MLESDKRLYKDYIFYNEDGQARLRHYQIFTADDDWPDCGHCMHVCDAQEICDNCGPAHAWNNYIRVEIEDIPLKADGGKIKWLKC